MKELFRLRIAGKRQITVPQRLMNVLDIDEGDELQVTVEDKRIVNAVPCRSVPAHLVSPEVAAAIEESRREIKANEAGDEHELARRIREASRSTSAQTIGSPTQARPKQKAGAGSY